MAKLEDRFKQAVDLHRQGKLAEAERAYQKVLRQRSYHVAALHNSGLLALQTQRPELAVELIGKAIALQPDNAEAWSNRGAALRALRRHDEALASFDKAIALKPDYVDAQYNRGIALYDLKRYADAVASYDRAIALHPNHAEAWGNRGAALHELKSFDPAVASCDRAIAVRRAGAQAWGIRGGALRELGRYAEALASCDHALALRPDDAEAQHNRGLVLQDLRRHDEAVVSFDLAIALRPDYALAYLNLSAALLQMGRFERGWRMYEHREMVDTALGVRSLPRPVWTGEQEIAGKTLFIYWEQGFGDTIQFCRYAKIAAARGAKVIMEVQGSLRTLLQSISPAIAVIPPDQAPDDFDYHCSLMSLPLAFQTTLASIPAEPRYLRADDSAKAVWLSRLPARTKPRIGVTWRGHPEHRNDHKRSIDLATFRSLFDRETDWICLQKDVSPEDAAMLDAAGGVMRVGDALHDFSDTAALVELLDLVITVDTSVAHLAGALGKPVWVLLPFNPDWRWLQGRDDSPWYPAARLFRQSRPGDWSGVIDTVRRALAER
jgi:tetratricopeptide (TPR) repeat protein